MKIIAQYHLTEREMEFLKAIEDRGGWVENRGKAEKEIFEAFQGLLSYMVNEGRLVANIEDAWHWSVELTEDGRQALAKYPAPHTVEIELTMVGCEEDEAD